MVAFEELETQIGAAQQGAEAEAMGGSASKRLEVEATRANEEEDPEQEGEQPCDGGAHGGRGGEGRVEGNSASGQEGAPSASGRPEGDSKGSRSGALKGVRNGAEAPGYVWKTLEYLKEHMKKAGGEHSAWLDGNPKVIKGLEVAYDGGTKTFWKVPVLEKALREWRNEGTEGEPVTVCHHGCRLEKGLLGIMADNEVKGMPYDEIGRAHV